MSKNFNCTNCGICCSIVPITEHEFQKIKRFVKNKMTLQQIYRLKNQERTPLQCIFFDNEKRICSVYPVRPDICKMYGFYKGMECHENPELATKDRRSGYKRIDKNVKKSKPKGLLSADIQLEAFLN